MTTGAPQGALLGVGNYDLLQKIAEGGMGTVYRGRRRDTGAVVAIKVVPPHLSRNPVLLKRFEKEFIAASRLEHPHIVRALDFGEDNGTPFLVMEFVDGESLGRRIERHGRLPEAEAIRIIGQVAQGLHKAHRQGLIHRDVKPDNILITMDGTAKLTDLGLVRELDTDLNLTRTGRGLGTPHFMAPEQFRNAKNADERCDVYSLGATLYMAVTGELPFRSLNPLDAFMKKVQNELPAPRSLVPSLTERTDWAIRRAMSPDPATRPASCREFVEDITGRSTRKSLLTPIDGVPHDLWYLVYQDEEGTTHTVKGTTFSIRRSLRDGLLGDATNIRAARSKEGPFEPLRSHPEFRDLVIDPAKTPPARTSQADKTTPIPLEPIRSASPPATTPVLARPSQPRAPAILLTPVESGGGLDWRIWLLIAGLAAGISLAATFWLGQP